MANNSKENLYRPMYAVSIFLFLTMLYWFGYDVWSSMGLTHSVADNFYLKFAEAGFFSDEFRYKAILTMFIILSVVAKNGGETDAKWSLIIGLIMGGFLAFFYPFRNALMFVVFSTIGYALLNVGFALLGRKARGFRGQDNDLYETFDQCRKKITNKYSINIPFKFQYHKRIHHGWINCVCPFRASIVIGTPGSGKSYSVYNQFIKQMIDKGYMCFVYDYKFPDLTEEIYNRYLQKYRYEKKKPKFCVINFDDPRYSMRCNPLDSRYLTDMSDAHEVADLIMKNINPKSVEREDFFSMSAKVYIAALVWFLKKYHGGIYCSFPHLIELMGKDYKSVFKILQQDEELVIMIQPFADALKGNAQEQLQGQIASARIPLLRFPSPSLYWTLTGDDFSLDLNNPDDPKIICMGNNPDRQAIYGTALALYTSRMFKVINHKYNASGKRNLHCGVLLDELPTIFIKGLDNLIATARSNLVAILLGAQDLSQLIRDYTEKEADVIWNTIGNIFAGQVNGRTAKSLSDTMGKEFRVQQSESTSKDSHSVSRSYHQEELLPQSRIETLTQGYFFGKVADEHGYKIEKKLFCGEIIVDQKERERFMEHFEKLPKFGEVHVTGKNPETGEPVHGGYFNDKKIEKTVRSNPRSYCIEYLFSQIQDDYYKELKRDPQYSQTYSDAELHKQAEDRYEEIDEETREGILSKVVKKAQDDEMQRMLIENYKRIQANVNEIFREYGISEEEAAGAAAPPVQSNPAQDAGFVDPTKSDPMNIEGEKHGKGETNPRPAAPAKTDVPENGNGEDGGDDDGNGLYEEADITNITEDDLSTTHE